MHEVLVNGLGGLSLPRKSVVRLTDRPDMTLDVYRGRETTIRLNKSWTNDFVNLTRLWTAKALEILLEKIHQVSFFCLKNNEKKKKQDYNLDVFPLFSVDVCSHMALPVQHLRIPREDKSTLTWFLGSNRGLYTLLEIWWAAKPSETCGSYRSPEDLLEPSLD